MSANEMKGIQGWVIRRVGGFPVNTNRAGLGSLRHSFELLCRGEMVVIFPEGNIFRSSQEIHSLKEGVARIALEVASTKLDSEIKILPVTIKYSQEIPGFGCDVEVKIGSCLNVGEYDRNSPKQEAVTLTKDLENSLKQLYAS